jgi:proteasome accessory factor A
MVKPEDFASDHPPVRIIGSEMEYDVQFRENFKQDHPHTLEFSSRPELASVLNPYNLEHLNLLPMFYHHAENGLSGGDYFLKNGARLYIDMSKFVEYATPESYGPMEAMYTDFAGKEIVKELGRLSGREDIGIYRRVGFAALNDRNQETTGYHENYLVSHEIEKSSILPHVMRSFLSSRQTWSGAGMINNVFTISQKAHGINRLVDEHDGTTQNGVKPMFNIHGSDDTAGSGWMRLETRCTDPLLSPRLRYLAFAATSLTLRLIEQNYCERILKRYTFTDVGNVNRQIAFDDKLNNIYQTYSGGRIRAIDYQKLLAEKALELSKKVELPADELQAAELWYDMCDMLSVTDFNDPDTIIETKLEWAARKKVIQKYIGDAALRSSNYKATACDIVWDRVDKQGLGEKWWVRTGETEHYAPKTTIANYMFKPPNKTRASIRSDYLHSENITQVGWDQISKADTGAIFLSNPYSR